MHLTAHQRCHGCVMCGYSCNRAELQDACCRSKAYPCINNQVKSSGVYSMH
jgi:hypothetical protein